MNATHLFDEYRDYNNCLKQFREIVNYSTTDIVDLFSKFYNILADSFRLSKTYMYALEFDPLISDYRIKFEYLPNRQHEEAHQKFVLKMVSGLNPVEPLYVFREGQVYESVTETLSPDVFMLSFLTFGNDTVTAIAFYTFEEKDNVIYAEKNMNFITNITSFLSIAVQKLVYENRLNKLLYNDNLTDAPNRSYFYHILVNEMQYADYTNTMVGVMMVDISKMKHVNDTLGYYIGDQVIKEVAHRIKSILGESFPLSRFSGDEFAVLIPNLTDTQQIRDICDKIYEVMKVPISLDQFSLIASVNIGISVFPTDGESVDTILKNAEAAMFQAKNEMDGLYRFYKASMTEESGKLLFLNSELLQAISNDEFELFYQAQLNIATNRIHSAEALIRWNHPVRGLLPPFEFIPFAEENGLIIEIDRMMLRKACLQAKKWYDAGKNITVGVNISADHFRHGDIVNSIIETLEETQVPAHLLEIEILESVMIEDMKHTIGIIEKIRSIGVIVSLDDFGSGYSSLEYITLLPLDIIKIDRGFTMHLEENPRNKIIVKTILALSKEMNFKVIAEGVEKQSHLDFLREQGCDFAQGYFINQPLPLDGIEDVMRKYNVEFC